MAAGRHDGAAAAERPRRSRAHGARRTTPRHHLGAAARRASARPAARTRWARLARPARRPYAVLGPRSPPWPPLTPDRRDVGARRCRAPRRTPRAPASTWPRTRSATPAATPRRSTCGTRSSATPVLVRRGRACSRSRSPRRCRARTCAAGPGALVLALRHRQHLGDQRAGRRRPGGPVARRRTGARRARPGLRRTGAGRLLLAAYVPGAAALAVALALG